MNRAFLKVLLTWIIAMIANGLSAQPIFGWAAGMGGGDLDRGTSTVDAQGNVYTTGGFRYSVDFDPGPGSYYLSTGAYFANFIQKLDAAGNFVWAKSIGGSAEDIGTSIAVSSSGDVYVTGSFAGTVDFDPGPANFPLTSASASYTDVFVMKLDSLGNFAWAERIGNALDDAGGSIAVDSADNVYISGTFQGTVDFNPNGGTYNITSAGSKDIFTTKLNASGGFMWAKSFAGTGLEESLSLALDASGYVYVSGNINSNNPVDADPGAGVFNITGGTFISKLTPDGDFVWAKQSGSAQTFAFKISVDAAYNVYTTGVFRNPGDFDPGPGVFTLTSNAWDDIFVSKLDSSGNFKWAKGIGGTQYDKGTGMAVDATGNVYLTGNFESTVDFDPGPNVHNMVSTGYDNVYILQLDSLGNFRWVKTFGPGGDLFASSLNIDASGNVVTTGNFRNTVDFDPDAGTYNLTSVQGTWDIYIQKLSNSTLPLHLLTFTAHLSEQRTTVNLRWTADNEINFDRYEIERSINGRDFFRIDNGRLTIDNAGTVHHYSYDDDVSRLTSHVSRLYYRLKMIDKDGSFTYSKVEQVSFNIQHSAFSITPNPATTAIQLQFNKVVNGKVDVQISDVAGKVLIGGQWSVVGGRLSIPTNKLANGTYVVKMIVEGEAWSEKVVVTR